MQAFFISYNSSFERLYFFAFSVACVVFRYCAGLVSKELLGARQVFCICCSLGAVSLN